MSTTDRAKQRGNEIGPTGHEVARNVKRIRLQAGLTQADLSKLLADLGRPVPVASVGKIESGDRRVEVDDLMAIAVALGVNPNALLMPYTRSPNDRAVLTGRVGTLSAGQPLSDAQELWAWAAGASPLDPEESWEDAEAQWQDFSAAALPWWAAIEFKVAEFTNRAFHERYFDAEMKRTETDG